ncbi:MAG: protein-L-isoaspartate(D-aspartate) O-methyltransferase [Actinobacteria bacterium]|nr:protein-L-isoaspartate(D-aspartate) O-methyltransferase [Actinomycetota bacterium]
MALRGAPDYEAERAEMVERQLRRRGIQDERVLEAMGRMPRELFVPEAVRRRAYDDSALPIGREQTISQPWVVAAICQALELGGDERMLEIGTGSGYSAAVLSLLAGSVVSVERIPELVAEARLALAEFGAENVELVEGDGTRGHEPSAPYDAIAVHAAGPEAPRSLLDQLADGGRLVMPVATGPAAPQRRRRLPRSVGTDMLTVFHRVGPGEWSQGTIGPCRFVPLIGAEGFEPRNS